MFRKNDLVNWINDGVIKNTAPLTLISRSSYEGMDYWRVSGSQTGIPESELEHANELLGAALAYASRGWHIHPLIRHKKTPLLTGWQEKATTDLDQTRLWWARYPHANIGIALLKSGLLLLDLDVKHGENGLETWETLKGTCGFNDSAVQQMTPSGGTHHIFAIGKTDPQSIADKKHFPGIDVKTKGYFVAEPSTTDDGEYAWEVSAHPADHAPSPLAPELVALMTAPGGQRRRAEPLSDKIPAGRRNELLTSLAGSMRYRGASEAAIQAALLVENATRCDPALSGPEVEKIAHSVAKYPPAEAFIEGKTFIPPLLGAAILEQTPFVNLTKEKTKGHLYSYHNGVYLRDGAARASDLVGLILKRHYRDNRAEEVTRWLEMRTRTDPQVANQHEGLINVRNGMVDWHTGKLYDHEPAYYSTVQLPTVYASDAKCPAIDLFLRQILPADCLSMMLEWIGYCLTPTTKYQKAMIELGVGANGKGTLLNVQRALVGHTNVSNIPLQELSDHRFKRAELEGKLVNAFADLDATVLKRSSYFKMIVAGDEIDAERKYGHPFTFKPFSRLMFSANKMPTSFDRSHAFYRRLLIVPFPNKFEDDNDDTNLLAKLTVPSELSGLLNLAILSLRQLTERGYFDQPATVQSAMAEYKRISDPLVAFLEDRCYTSDTEILEVARTVLYNRYKEFCEAGKAFTEKSADFYARLREMFPNMRDTRLRREGKIVRLFVGGPALQSGEGEQQLNF